LLRHPRPALDECLHTVVSDLKRIRAQEDVVLTAVSARDYALAEREYDRLRLMTEAWRSAGRVVEELIAKYHEE